MSAPTAARPTSDQASHYYWPDGRPCYEVPNKSNGGMRSTTVGDAKKLGLLPSVTTILGVLDKPGLNRWKEEQCVLAAMTTPRIQGEADDAFIYRVLHAEKQQDSESQKARDRGVEIHQAIEDWFNLKFISMDILGWIQNACGEISTNKAEVQTEQILVGDGYAGKCDLIQTLPDSVTIWDFKTAKVLPDKPWLEHVLQLSAYADAYFQGQKLAGFKASGQIKTANCYISTVDKGAFKICVHEEPWHKTFERGFKPLLDYWRWSKGLV